MVFGEAMRPDNLLKINMRLGWVELLRVDFYRPKAQLVTPLCRLSGRSEVKPTSPLRPSRSCASMERRQLLDGLAAKSMRRPVRADSRAASRISATVTFSSGEERPVDF